MPNIVLTPPTQIKQTDRVDAHSVNQPISELYSMLQTVCTEINNKNISTPEILSPDTNASIFTPAGVTATSSPFISADPTDTHIRTDWKITSDAAGNNIIVADMDTGDLTSHTFKNPVLTASRSYYIFCRYRGHKSSHSDWSQGRKFVSVNVFIAPSGRKLYRNEYNTGTVVECTIRGVRTLYTVADAAYRSQGNWAYDYCVNTDTALTNYTKNYFYPSPSGNYEPPSTLNTNTDTNIDAKFNAAGIVQNETSKALTELKRSDGKHGFATDWPVTLDVQPGGWVLPKLEVLYRILCDAEALDAMDPTVESNKNYALGSSNPSGFWRIGKTWGSWAICEYNAQHAWYVNYNGYVYNTSKDYVLSVVPVLEG